LCETQSYFPSVYCIVDCLTFLQKLYNTPPASPTASAADFCLQFRRGRSKTTGDSPYKAASQHGTATHSGDNGGGGVRLEREGGTLPMETSVLMDDVLSDGMGCRLM
jgi:hypothetical protein